MRSCDRRVTGKAFFSRRDLQDWEGIVEDAVGLAGIIDRLERSVPDLGN